MCDNIRAPSGQSTVWHLSFFLSLSLSLSLSHIFAVLFLLSLLLCSSSWLRNPCEFLFSLFLSSSIFLLHSSLSCAPSLSNSLSSPVSYVIHVCSLCHISRLEEFTEFKGAKILSSFTVFSSVTTNIFSYFKLCT